MASGGGSHPSHLPIGTRPHGSKSTSLQTPDTSALFVSTLGSKTGGGGRVSMGTGFPTDQEHSFTSLEELLDVTGINSMELGHSDMDMLKEPGRGGHGVDSLQMLARQVEMNSGLQDANDGIGEPPSKRHCNESSNWFGSSTGTVSYTALDKLSYSSSNISVHQSLHTPPPSSSTNYLSPIPSPSPPQPHAPMSSLPLSLPMSPATQSTFVCSSGPSTPIVSLLDRRHCSPARDADVEHQQFPAGLVAGPAKVLGRPLCSPPPYSLSASSSANQPIQAFAPAVAPSDYQQNVSGNFSASGSVQNNYHLPGVSVGQPTSWTATPQPQTSRAARHPLPAILSQPSATSSNQRFLPAVSSHQTSQMLYSTSHVENAPPPSSNDAHVTSNSATLSHKPKLAAPPTTSTASQVAESINSNSKAVVIQLIQLYKQYQEANDQQGMARVREQINFLVSAQQKILAAQNSIVRSGANSAMNGPANQPSVSNQVSGMPVSGVETSVGVATTRPVTTELNKNEQQQQANKILSHLSTLKKSQDQPATTLPTSSLATRFGKSATQGLHRDVGGGLLTNSSNVVSNSPGVTGRGPIAQGGGSVGGGILNLPAVSVSPNASLPPQSVHSQGASQPAQNQGIRNPQETLKHLQLLMATLPESKRPKNLQELKVFIQQYSSLVSKGNALSSSNSQLSVSAAPSLPSYSASLERAQSQAPHAAPSGLAQVQNSAGKTLVSSALPVAPKNSLSVGATQTYSRLPVQLGGLMSNTVSPATITVSSHPMTSGSGPSKHSFNPSSDNAPRVNVAAMAQSLLNLKSSSSSASSMGQAPAASAAKSGIQPGVATPLPNGVTLETLGVLCRLPDNDLLKLNLPQPLLSAIKVWKARQSSNKTKMSNSANKSNIPVLIPPPAYSIPPSSSTHTNSPQLSSNSTATSSISSTIMTATKTGIVPNHTSSLPLPKSALGQPNVLPSGAGFPPRSLHAFIPRQATVTIPQAQPSPGQHMTRFKLKMEQHKAEAERLQALQKALQSSEEARIAYRFSAHLEKMHTQLMNPDTVSSFKSHHDILARLLPYHIYAEPEPPAAAVEKADAVYESVAQVLLSRSRGLKSRYDKIMLKAESQGGLEQSKMRFQLDQLFIKGQQERIQRENQEKKQAAQIAADLSTMAETTDSFDTDFSFGDVFSPLMSLNSGIT